MQVVYSPEHRVHAPAECMSASGPFRHREVPQRAEAILAALEADRRFVIVPPGDPVMNALEEVHAADYRAYLAEIHAAWISAGEAPSIVVPELFPGRGGRRAGRHPANRAGWFGTDTFTPILAGTAEAAREAARCALTAVDLLLAGEERLYALTRPPGHHAGRDFHGGFCYFNNAAVATAHLARETGGRIAVLDIDAHHGNGTQEIFYASEHVLTVSLHADPNEEFPYYWGYAEETGIGPGEGLNLNLPLPLGADDSLYLPTFARALERIAAFAPRYLIVSLGVDGIADDPIGHLSLAPEIFGILGHNVRALGIPTLVVQEGGYRITHLGTCVRDFLSALD